MKYYKVKPESDQLPKWYKGKRTGFLIANELYTEKESEKIFIRIAFNDCFDIVEISSKKTFWMFGARFGIKLS